MIDGILKICETLPFPHSQMEHYFFSYLLTWEVDLIENLEIMAQTWHFLNPKINKGDFSLYFESVEKSCWGGATTHKYEK